MVATLRAIGDPHDAVRLGRALLARPEAHADLVWQVARTELLADGLSTAVRTLAEYVRKSPRLSELPARPLAEWTAALKAHSGAVAALDELRKVGARDFADDFVLALCALALDRSDLAEELLAACTAARPDFVPALAARGRMLLMAYRWEDAKANARELLKKEPSLAAAYFILAEAHDGLDENDDAEKAYKQAARLAPTEAAYPLALGNHCLRLGDPQGVLGAQRSYSDALAIDPRSGEAHERLIQAYLLKDMADLARDQFRRMQAADAPEDAVRRAGTVIRHMQAPLSRTHLEDLKAQAEAHPEDARTAEVLARALLAQRRPDDAASRIDRALAAAPDDAGLLVLRGEIENFRGEFDRAIATFESLTRRFPNREALLATLAQLYEVEFRVEEARTLFRRLMAFEKEDRAPYSLALLETFVNFGDWDAAIQHMDALIDRFRGNESIVSSKIRILTLAGRHEQAFALAAERLAGAGVDSPTFLAYVEAGRAAHQHEAVIKTLRDRMAAANPLEAMELTPLLVQTLLDAGKGDEALKLVKEFNPRTQEQSNQRRLWFGICYRALGKHSVAIDEFEALLTEPGLRPDLQARARQALVAALIMAREYDRGLELCDKWGASAGDEASLDVLEYRRSLLQAAGRDPEYIQLCRKILERTGDPSFVEQFPASAARIRIGLKNDLGYTLADRGEDLAGATAMVREAVAAEPLNAAYLDSLGWACYKAADFAGAEKWLARAIRVYGYDEDRWGATEPVQHDHYADALFRLGRREDASKHWELALKYVDDEAKGEPLRPDQEKLKASATEKLTALKAGGSPRVAPTAAEQAEKK
jgi:tetratricopeptide (TPR) repeat protein